MASNNPHQLSDEHIDDLCSRFKSVNANGSGYIDVANVREALDVVGLKIPQWEARKILDEMGLGKKTTLNMEDFQKIFHDLKSKDAANSFRSAVSKRENLDKLGGMSEASSEGTTHCVRLEEEAAFIGWINSNLGSDPDLKHILPIDNQGRRLYDAINDGTLLCKMINLSAPDTIDERVINKKNLSLYMKHENLELALNSARSIGCNVVNMHPEDFLKGKQHLVLGLLWQIIRIGLFNHITLQDCPGLVRLFENGEEMNQFLKLSPENILLRWVNFHLAHAGVNRRMTNFTSDVKDSMIYSHLLKQIAPNEARVTLEALEKSNLMERATLMLKQADKIGCCSFVTAKDVVSGAPNLNLAFVANLFNNFPGLADPEERHEAFNIEETREEKTYRNWMNSMGVNPMVNYLYSDLCDGLVIFQLYDSISPGKVDRTRVHEKFSKLKAFMEKVENCNYAVELGKEEFQFKLIGIAGTDLMEGNPTLTLGLIWQLMKQYTLSILKEITKKNQPVTEKEIVEWVNSKLKEAGKDSSIKNFNDSSISTAMPVLDLIDAIQPGSVNYSQVLNANSDEEKLANAKFAISMARKIGAKVYALPEDITEVKQKMVLTVFACLMSRAFTPGSSANQ